MRVTADGFAEPDPHDIAAEQCVLGGMLLSADAIADVAGVISADDHYRPAHQVIHEMILDLHGRGHPVDAMTVKAALESTGHLGTVGGAPYLHTLIESVPVAANAGYYARIVSDRSRQRRLIELGTRLSQVGRDTGSGAEVPPALLADLADLAAAGSAATASSRDRAQVDQLVRTLRVQAAARAVLAGESAPAIPESAAGHDFLSQPDEEARYRIGGLWPAGGNVMLAAQFKAGKTTMRDNLIRSLCDGSPFLGQFPVTPPGGRVFVVDCEMPPSTSRRWLAAQMISRADRFEYLNLRGAVASFAILVPEIRARWARRVAESGASVFVLDCIGPVLAALGLDESKSADVGLFLSAFEEMLATAGVTESAVIHHMGHDAERSRGASRLRDWPDAEWRLVRQDPGPASARYLSAYGRDVDFAESRLDYDPETRHLAIGGGSRRTERGSEARQALAKLLGEEPDLSANKIEKLLGDDHARQAIRDAIKEAVKEGQVLTKTGARSARLHYLNPDFADLAGPRRDDAGEVGVTSPVTLVDGEVTPTADGLASSPPEAANSTSSWGPGTLGDQANGR